MSDAQFGPGTKDFADVLLGHGKSLLSTHDHEIRPAEKRDLHSPINAQLGL